MPWLPWPTLPSNRPAWRRARNRQRRHLPAALLSNILKELHHHGLLHSTRGARGGYELACDASAISLHELIVAMEGPIRLVACAEEAGACEHETPGDADACRVSGRCAVQAPLQALHHRLVQFLKRVKLSDVAPRGDFNSSVLDWTPPE